MHPCFRVSSSFRLILPLIRALFRAIFLYKPGRFAIVVHPSLSLFPLVFDAIFLRIFFAALLPARVYGNFLPPTFGIYFLRDLLPAHFHFLRDSRSGELGFFAALGCFFI